MSIPNAPTNGNVSNYQPQGITPAAKSTSATLRQPATRARLASTASRVPASILADPRVAGNKGLSNVLQCLENPQRSGEQWSARCPSHPDQHNSLSVGIGKEGKILLQCHAYCSFNEVWAALKPKVLALTNGAARASQTRVAAVSTRVLCATPQSVAHLRWKALNDQFRSALLPQRQKQLAESLGVTETGLEELQVGWHPRLQAYTFPERASPREICGISTRAENGEKKVLQDSKRGLYLPVSLGKRPGPIFIVEGATDTAALTSMGLAVVGRPSALARAELLDNLLARVPKERSIIVVGEFDPKQDGRWPGREAAELTAKRLSQELRRPVQWALPPESAKDAREWLRQAKSADPSMSDDSDLGQRFSKAVLEAAITVVPSSSRVEFIDAATFANSKYAREWLVRSILVAGQPAIVGGAKKTLKTTLVLDLAVSIAAGQNFLGNFAVPNQRRVGLLSGESGEATLQETFIRICKAKNIPDPKRVDVQFGFRLPQLSKTDDLQQLQELIRERGLGVVIIDPLYLCLLNGNTELQAQNLFQIGPLLAEVAQSCLEAGATPILVHHNRKGPAGIAQKGSHGFAPPELEDLAFSGMQEFARQWLLIGRRRKYEPGSGEHALWLSTGGSAGHGGCWALDLDEGTLAGDFRGRRWQIEVRTASEERDALEQQKTDLRNQQNESAREQILEVLRQLPEGETRAGLIEATGLTKTIVDRLIDQLTEEGLVEPCEVAKGGGRGSRGYPGYCLSTPAG